MPTKKDKNLYSSLKLRSGLSAYISEIEKISLLTKEQESDFAQSYASCCQPLIKNHQLEYPCPSCAAAKYNLIVSNLRFVVSIAKKYQSHRTPLVDLINEGNMD